MTEHAVARRRPGAARPAERPTATSVRGAELLALQRSAGNRAVAALQALQREAAGGDEVEVAGDIPAAQLGGEREGTHRGPPAGFKGDRSDGGTSAGDGRPGSAPASRPQGHQAGGAVFEVEVGDVGFNHTMIEDPSVATGSSRGDGIEASATINWSTSGGLGVQPFGEMVPSHQLTDATFTAKSSKKQNTIKVSFTVDAATRWGVDGGGNKDISTGDEAEVTADTYKAIVEDLTPRTGSYGGQDYGKSWVPVRNAYWSRAMTERHEQYHATDERDWLRGQGRKFVVNYLKGKTVSLTDEERADATKIAAKMAPVLQDARDALAAASDLYYMGSGVSYYNRPGEIRAFGDGKAGYVKLVSKVKKRGRKLEQKAKKAGGT